MKKLMFAAAIAASAAAFADPINSIGFAGYDLGAKFTSGQAEKDESGNETVKLDYDREAISKALQKFTEEYNKTVDAAGNSNSMSALRNGAYLTKSTAVNSKLLSKAGITVGLDNKLSFDQDKLNEADITSVKSLFTGYGSYASQLLNRSNAIASASAPSSYNRNGSYSYLNNLNSSFSVLM